MRRFESGDEVRVDIPDNTDPDYRRFHGKRGEIIETIADDAGEETGDERDSLLYRVALESDEVMDFRWRDLRPVFNE
jgi:hypothetical protein